VKEFITAVEEVLTEDENEAKIKARVAELVAQFVAGGMSEDEAVPKAEAQAHSEIEGFVPFELAHMEPTLDDDGKVQRDDDGKIIAHKVVDRVLHAYQPTEGQLIFMLASLGRGQGQDQRFASIINIMLASLREEDAEYLEKRLLERDRKKRLPPEKIEQIFEYLVEQWFGGKVTVPPSGSAR
jgi:hypothetical protein